MTTLYLTRHGETVFNAEVKAQGWVDSPLTEIGIENAKALKSRMDKMDIDVIYTSPLGRAVTTAEILKGDRKIEIIKDARLKEYQYGFIDGMPYSEATEKLGFDIMKFFRNIPTIHAENYGGETFDNFYSRLSSCLEEIVRENEGKKVVIVSHAITTKGLIHYAKKMAFEEWSNFPRIGQASLTEIHHDENGFAVQYIGDTSHYTVDPSPQP